MKLMLTAVLMALAAPLTACGTDDGGADGRATVVTSFYPLEYLVHEIAPDQVEVLALTAPGVEPHDLELSVRQVGAIGDADLVVYESGFQPAVDDAVEQGSPEETVDVTDVVELDAGDPHFWLDPARMLAAAKAIEPALAAVVPDRADELAANLADLEEELTLLDEEYRQGLADCERNLVVTSHDAFGYQEKYGLRFRPIAGLSPDAEPSAGHLAELRDLIRTEAITTVFSETLASPKMAETLATDLGLTAAVLDPLEGLEDDTDGDYASLMRANLAALQQANGCKVSS